MAYPCHTLNNVQEFCLGEYHAVRGETENSVPGSIRRSARSRLRWLAL